MILSLAGASHATGRFEKFRLTGLPAALMLDLRAARNAVSFMARAPNYKRFSMRAAADNRWSRLARAAVRKYYADLLSVRAAALSYWTLLSLVPLLAVAFSVLKAFDVQNLIETFLIEALEPLGAGRTEVTDQIVRFVGNARVGVLGAAGVAGLLYTAVSLIGNIEEALNQIWRAQPVRAWTRRYGEYFGLLLIGPVLMFAAFAMIASAQSYWLVQRLIEMQLFGSMVALIARVLPFFFLWTGFALLYKIMPSADVRLRSAVFGAAVAAILWHLAGIAFTAFVADSRNYTALYSGFAVAVVFFLWLNLAWLIVLFGATVAYLHQHAHLYARGEPVEMPGPAAQELLALRVLSEIARHYVSGKPPLSESRLSDCLVVPLAQIDPVIEKCVGRGLLLRAAEPPGVSLARAPENISATEVLETVRGEFPASRLDDDPIAALLRRRDRALHRELDGITLKSLSQESLEDSRQSESPIETRSGDH